MSAGPAVTRASILLAATIAEMGVFALPLMVGTIASQYGVEPGEVGFLISAQIGCFSLATFGLAPIVHRIDRRMIALAGAVVIILGNLASAIAPSFAVLTALRAFTGLGEGIAMAAMTAAAAEARLPEKIFAQAWLTIVVMSIAIAILVPTLLTSGGAALTFAAMAAAVAVTAPLLIAFPRRLAESAIAIAPVNLRSAATLRLGAATALFAIAINGAWAFIERIGHSHGLDVTQVGHAILIASLLAIGGPVATLLLKDRFGRAVPIAAMLLLSAVGVMMTTHAAGGSGFVAGLSLSSFCLVFGMPYLLGLAAAMDPAGRIATSVRAFGAVGNTLTPSIAGGLLLLGAGYGAIGWTAVGCTVIAALLVLPIAARSDRGTASR